MEREQEREDYEKELDRVTSALKDKDKHELDYRKLVQKVTSLRDFLFVILTLCNLKLIGRGVNA